ncbi:unnamed protein product, partial [Mesorhabditis spiculigera]
MGADEYAGDEHQRPVSGKKAKSRLPSLEQLLALPVDIWLLLLDAFTPLDIVNLAHADRRLKVLMTALPKRWGRLMGEARQLKIYSSANVNSFQLTRAAGCWDESINYIFAYGDTYWFVKHQKENKLFNAMCRYVEPDRDRNKAIAEDLYILLNNARVDMYCLGSDWNLPTPKKSPMPSIRAATVLLSINGDVQGFDGELERLGPTCIAYYAQPEGGLVDFRSHVRHIAAIPSLRYLWINVGDKFKEFSRIVRLKMPQLTIHCTLGVKKVMKDERQLTHGAEKWLKRNLVESLRSMIEEWQRKERVIDKFELVMDWGWLTFTETRDVVRALVDGRCDAREADHIPIIRRGPWSRDGLMIQFIAHTITIAECDYNFRINRTWREIDANSQVWGAFARWRYHDFPELIKESKSPEELLVYKRDFEGRMSEWVNRAANNTIPSRELLFIDPMHRCLLPVALKDLDFFGQSLVLGLRGVIEDRYEKMQYDNWRW